ncbi:MAG: N-acetylmuramoyl-L-alanine amidase [bacterium]|nr:N-acetylmuramoyl-L-alanine amidase [bacterium]
MTFLLFTLTALGGIFFVVAPLSVRTVLVRSGQTVGSQPASVFFIESSKPEVLKQTVAMAAPNVRKLRILVVPGHDNEFVGTNYKGVTEADMTLPLGKELARLLSEEDKFDVILSRDDNGYMPELAYYFREQKEEILEFVASKKKIMKNLEAAGKVSLMTDGVYHNDAPSPVVVRLYGINKWANENDVDLVVHVHFNDYPRRKRASPGTYSGFSIYVPEQQFSNARSSKDIADAVSKQLQTYYPPSNMPKEGNGVGVVEDQELIAIGAFNTLDPAALLIEYGYIYEPQFLNPTIRSKVIEDLAIQTYIGIHNFFGVSLPKLAGKYNTALLPHTFQDVLAAGVKNNLSVLSLQAALVLEGVYPPDEFDDHACPLAGTYGPCTKKSIADFQKKYNILGESGKLGAKTIQKLNELYGE